jgi:transcriptional regulator with XRE-family HTH domain
MGVMIPHMSNVIEFPAPPVTAWARVAAEVRAATARANLEQAALAKAAAISKSTLSRRFKPQRKEDAFRVDELERIAGALGISVTAFFATVDGQRGPDDDGGSRLTESNRRPSHYRPNGLAPIVPLPRKRLSELRPTG